MPDERVQAAVHNWAPRFTTQGVDYNDFAETTARIERWDDWCKEWCATGNMHAHLAQQAEQQGRTLTAGQAYISAALCYHFGKFMFQDHPQEYRAAGRQSIDSFARGLRLLDPSGERVEIPLDGATMVGTLRCPPGVDRPALVLLLAGLDSTKEEFFYWEEVFLKRGLATLSLDGPGQGECGYETTIRPDYEAAVSALLDGLAARSDIDLRRVGAAGVSLGGYYAARALAYEPRMRAAVEICGPWNLAECWQSMNVLSRQAFQDHSGAKDAAEAQLNAAKLTLESAAPQIRKPLLVIHGKLDRLIPWEQALKIAGAAGKYAELALFDQGNHVCNNIPYIYRPLTADWLVEKLGT
jgi:dipeptidyl aminopeptidase/acylaminoacyl peptidase